MERIGFIGLGIMGAPMASNLCKAGYPPAVYDLNPTAVQRLTAQGSRELPLSAMGAEDMNRCVMVDSGIARKADHNGSGQAV